MQLTGAVLNLSDFMPAPPLPLPYDTERWGLEKPDGYYSDDEDQISEDHTTEPIKDINDIKRIYDYFMANGQYKSAVMFTVGINVGMRITDLLNLRYETFYDKDWTPKTETYVLEFKTKNTKGKKQKRMDANTFARKTQGLSREEKTMLLGQWVDEADNLYEVNARRKMTPRRFKANELVYHALDAYRNTLAVSPQLDDYIFKNTSRNSSGKNVPMSRVSAWRVFDQVCKDLNLGIKIGTHGLRKTFGYHMMDINHNSDEALHVLQQLFGHSSPEITLKYVGITKERINNAYDDVGNRFEEVIVYPEILSEDTRVG